MADLLLDLGRYPVLLGSDVLHKTSDHAPSSRQAVILHQAASKTYAQAVAQSVDRKTAVSAQMVRVPDGEKAKALGEIEKLYRRALEFRLERTDVVYAVGGGCLGDAAGFFAATYLRGLPLVHVPTTLLSQVDSSIGGKVAVNLGATKNMVGAFYHPQLVVDDVDTLQSLPDEQLTNGLAEVIKYGLILDADFFHYVQQNLASIKSKDLTALLHVVQQSVQIKGALVARDEREAHERMKLNYGHTLGHGIEAVTGLPHGYAISVGMHAAGILSVKKGLLGRDELEKQSALLEAAGLPLYAKASVEAVMTEVQSDKKRAAGRLRMALLERIGSCRIEDVTYDEAQSALEQVLT